MWMTKRDNSIINHYCWGGGYQAYKAVGVAKVTSHSSISLLFICLFTQLGEIKT